MVVDRVGGRTVTVPLRSADGTDYWDLGGQWVGRWVGYTNTGRKEMFYLTLSGRLMVQTTGRPVGWQVSGLHKHWKEGNVLFNHTLRLSDDTDYWDLGGQWVGRWVGYTNSGRKEMFYLTTLSGRLMT